MIPYVLLDHNEHTLWTRIINEIFFSFFNRESSKMEFVGYYHSVENISIMKHLYFILRELYNLDDIMEGKMPHKPKHSGFSNCKNL